MRIAIWIVQGLLAAAFFMAGTMKTVTPIAELLASGMTFVEFVPAWLVRFIGISEVAGALGLVLPSVTRVLPKLTPVAATLLAVVMVLAVGTHMLLGEFTAIGAPVALGLFAGFVAWIRFGKYAITPRHQTSMKTQTA